MNNKYRYSLDLDNYVDRDIETDNEGVTSAIMGKKTNVVAPEESDYSRFRKDFATKIKNAYSDYEEFSKLFATNYVPVDRDEVNSHVDKLMPTKDKVSSVGHTSEELVDIKTQVESAIELEEEPTGIMTKPKARPNSVITQGLLNRIAIGEGADPKKLQNQAKHGIGTTEYDMVYNYGDTLKPNKPITEMKLSELAAYQKKLINATRGSIKGTTPASKGTSAVGKYQVVHTSLFGAGGTAQSPKKNSWADKLNLNADTIYSPKVQEDIGRLILREAGYDNWLAGNKSEKSMLKDLAGKWASIEGSTANQGTSSTSIKDLEPFLSQVRP